MKVYYQLDQIPALNNTVLTIGSFDGIHHGHQQLLDQIKQLAHKVKGESLVVTFHPHPRQVVYPNDNSLKLLSTIEEKVALFEHYGIDHLVVVPFTLEFSQQSADQYIEDFLVGHFQPSYIVIGYDHKFGQNRAGDINYLKKHQDRFGYKVVEIAPQEIADMAVSSTKVRKALEQGNIKSATALLAHAYMLGGQVVKGQQLGRQLGFPTANIQPHNRFKLVPKYGIYAARVHFQQKVYQAMLYIGNRPSIKQHQERSIEVNIFDFDQDIYDQELNIEFVDFIREDATFDSMEALSQQLAKDKEAALAVLNPKEKQKIETISKAVRASIVILNYNGASYLEQFLPGVIASAAAAKCEVIVADNASTDHSVQLLKDKFPAVELICMEQNHGFAAGYNQALAQLKDRSPYYVLLNSDVEVPMDWLNACLDRLDKDTSIAACQPKIKAFHEKDFFEYAGAAGGWIDTLGYPFCKGRIFSVREEDKGQYDTASEIFWASGAALFIRSDLFHALEGFDQDYFAHAEEIDLCWRLRKAGYKIYYEPGSTVYHIGGGTLDYLSPTKAYLNFRNTLVTSFKNEAAAKLLWWLPLRLLMDGLAGALFLSQGKWGHIRAIVKAHWHFFPRIPFWWRKRKQYQQLIAAISIGNNSKGTGWYGKSIVWQFYAKGKKYFTDLVH